MSILALTAVTLGLHIGSVHIPAKAHQNNSNPGVYFRTEEGWSAGCYHNTIRRTSCYGLKAWDWGPVSLGFGGVSGYQKKCATTYSATDKHGRYTWHRECEGVSHGAIAPMILLSYTPPIKFEGVQPRLSLIPGIAGAATALHMSLEF